MPNKRFYNPIIKDEIEILLESKHKLVFRTYLQPNGGQSGLHYHTNITETFKIIQGSLNIFHNGKERVLKTNDELSIKKFESHKFFNKTNDVVIFEVEINDPKEIMKGLQIIYGLANDRKVYKNGLPKNILYTAIAINKMDAYIPNVPLFVQKVGISILALVGKITGLESRLVSIYC